MLKNPPMIIEYQVNYKALIIVNGIGKCYSKGSYDTKKGKLSRGLGRNIYIEIFKSI